MKGFAARDRHGSLWERFVRTEESSTGISTKTPTRQTQEANQVDVRQEH